MIVALVEISQLKSEVTGLSTLQQNVSDVMEAIATIATNLDRTSDDQLALQILEQLLMLQQNVVMLRRLLPLIFIIPLMISLSCCKTVYHNFVMNICNSEHQDTVLYTFLLAQVYFLIISFIIIVSLATTL